jgi:coenzyme F420-reducing hydrogenase delta subunit
VARGVDPVLESGCQSNHTHAVAGDWKKSKKKIKINKSKKELK